MQKDVIGTIKLVLSVFLAGSGLVIWLFSIALNPQNEIRQSLALIQQDISSIKDDIRDFTGRVAEIEKEQRSLSERLVKLESK